MSHPEGFLGFVLEGVDEDDPGHVRLQVAVEGLGRRDGVAEDQHERVGHRAGRGEAGQAGAGGVHVLISLSTNTIAKGLAQATGIAMVGVNHIEGHLLAPLLENRIAMPYLALVVSGGHTALFAVEDFGRYRRIGRTRDDAAGEAFDKVAKLMGLGYPGGRAIDELSRRGNRKQVRIPRAHVKGAPMDFSFSGVKTSVATLLATAGGHAALDAVAQLSVITDRWRPRLASLHGAAELVAVTTITVIALPDDLTEPDLAGAYYNRGNVLQTLGRLEESLADYERAIGPECSAS